MTTPTSHRSGAAGPFAIVAATDISTAADSSTSGSTGGANFGGEVALHPTEQFIQDDFAVGGSGKIYLGGTEAAIAAQAAVSTAYTDASSRGGWTAITVDLGGQTLPPGVYKSVDAITLASSGTLALDGGGDPDAIFIFQVGSTKKKVACC